MIGIALSLPTLAGAGVVGAAALTAYGTFWPRSRLFAPVIYRGDASDPPRVALTFDDGPHPQATAAILDALAVRQSSATFFVIGANVRRWPDLVRRAHEAGHVIASHSYDHAWSGMWRGQAYWEDQLQRTIDAVAGVIGRRPALFRPPMGFKQPRLAAAARRHHQHIVTWTRRALDGRPTSPDRIVARLASHARPGDILALHDGIEPHHPRRLGPAAAALPPLLHALSRRRLALTTLDRLTGCPAYLPD